MANIQTHITNRHYWQPQRLRSDHDEADARGFVLGLLCTNCRHYWVPGQPGPPVGGCLSGVNLKLAGRARTGDYEEQEMRLRAIQERVDPRDLPTA